MDIRKLVNYWRALARNAWWNPFRPWPEQMTQLMGAKCWWDTMAILHPLPIAVAILGAVLLMILPEDILSRSPVLSSFTNLMGWLVPGIPAFAANTGSQPLLLVHTLNWLFVPYWLSLTYRAGPVLQIVREKRYIKNIAAMPPERRTRGNFVFLILGGPFLISFMFWGIWSGFGFIGGPPSIVRGLVYENLILLTFWNWLLPMGFMCSIYFAMIYVAMLPVYLRFVILGRIK